MPTYEYACAACGTRSEVQQKMTDDSLTVCPACGAPGLRKMFANVGVVFKGSGFYRNDSRDSKKSTSDSSTPATSTSSDSGSSSSPSTSSSDSGSSTTTSTPAPASTPAAPKATTTT